VSAKGPPEPDKKRRLPLLPKVEVAAEGDEDRPPWHWSAIGAVGVFVLWLPLALVINGALAGPRTEGAAPAILNGAAFALAAFVSGFLVGRFGGRAGRREATLGGVAAAATAWIIAASQGARGPVTWLLVLAILVGVGGGAARAGGALGVARRRA
jgi:tRNA-(ms[2]io[6]A)-hydroxylase